jgi:putative ABC transport system substrate-binding protein
MQRREFITLLGGAASLPLVARAQHSERMRRIGWLDPAPESDPGVQARMRTVRQELERAGWTIGRNLEIDYRWGTSDIQRARSASSELLSRAPDVILCAASPA